MDASKSAWSRGVVLAWGCGIVSWELGVENCEFELKVELGVGSWELGWGSLSSSAPDRRFPYDAWANKYAADITRPRVKWR